MTSVALRDFHPALLVSLRLLIGAALLGGLCAATGVRLPAFSDRRSWIALVVIAATGTLFPFSLISTAQQALPSALAAIYVAASPLCVAVLANVLVPGERLTWRRALGVMFGFVGVAALFVPGLLGSDLSGVLPVVPQLMVLAAAISYATSGILVRLSGLSIAPLALSFGFCTCAAVMSVPLALATGATWPSVISVPSSFAVLGLGVFSTGVGAWVYVLSIRNVGAVMTSNVGNLAPFWSLLVGTAFLSERLPATAFVALLMILAGIGLVQSASKGVDTSAG
jgi:drug/metabolite transporter (DMT)-like permease